MCIPLILYSYAQDFGGLESGIATVLTSTIPIFVILLSKYFLVCVCFYVALHDVYIVPSLYLCSLLVKLNNNNCTYTHARIPLRHAHTLHTKQNTISLTKLSIVGIALGFVGVAMVCVAGYLSDIQRSTKGQQIPAYETVGWYTVFMIGVVMQASALGMCSCMCMCVRMFVCNCP